MSTMLSLWMRRATTAQQQELADALGTSRAYLYHLAASPDKRYAREPAPALAARIEDETARMHDATDGALPRLYRSDMNSACRQCQFAARCLGSIVNRSDFDVVADDRSPDSEGGAT